MTQPIIKKNKKAISTFIATLLLMVLAVSAGVVIYAYVMGYLGGFTGTTQTMGAMSIDSASLTSGTPGKMTVYLRNIGHTAIVFDKAYVNGASAVIDVTYPDLGTSLPEGSVAEVTIDTVNFVAAKTYEFRIIAQDNTQIIFNLKAGGTSGSGGPGTYALTVTPSGSGTVTLDPAGGSYAPDTVVTLTPNPAAGWSFTSWGGDLSGSDNPETITMDAAKAVTANFRMFYKTITFGAGAVGTQTNFPALISIQDEDEIAARSTNGAEIYFTSDAAGTIVLDHDLLSYSEDGSGADVTAWVKVPSLASGGMIYVWYGGSSPAVENPTGVWDSNYRGVWHLEEAGTGAIGEYQDSTSNNNDGRGGAGTSDRVPTQITGKIGNAQDFEGDTTSDFIDVGSSTSLQITGSITLESWIWIESYEPEYYHMVICRQYGTSTGDGYLLFTDDSLKAYIAVNAASGSVSTSAPTTGSWHHVVGVASDSTMRIYVDGNELATTTGKIWTLDTNEVTIGAGNNGAVYPNEPFDGRIDEVRISSIVRSPQWIQTEYNNMNNPVTFISVGSENFVS